MLFAQDTVENSGKDTDHQNIIVSVSGTTVHFPKFQRLKIAALLLKNTRFDTSYAWASSCVMNKSFNNSSNSQHYISKHIALEIYILRYNWVCIKENSFYFSNLLGKLLQCNAKSKYQFPNLVKKKNPTSVSDGYKHILCAHNVQKCRNASLSEGFWTVISPCVLGKLRLER